MLIADDFVAAEPKNINLHGAVLHVIGDLVQSLGVAVAGAVIWIKQAITLPLDAPAYLSVLCHGQA